MDPDKRLTCAQLLQHSFFDGFASEFEREKKEVLRSSQREMNKMLLMQQQQQQQQAAAQQSKPSNPNYVSGAGQSKGQTQGVSVLLCQVFFTFPHDDGEQSENRNTTSIDLFSIYQHYL